MPRYRLKYGKNAEFDAQGPGEVVPFIAEKHFAGGEDEDRFMRRLAMEFSDWNRGNLLLHEQGQACAEHDERRFVGVC